MSLLSANSNLEVVIIELCNWELGLEFQRASHIILTTRCHRNVILRTHYYVEEGFLLKVSLRYMPYDPRAGKLSCPAAA